MENDKLNSLVLEYQKNHCEEVFREIYTILSGRWKNLRSVSASIISNEHDTLAAYEDTLLRCLSSYDGRGDFINLYNRSTWRARRDIYKKEKYRFDKEISEKQSSNGDEGIITLIKSDYDLESEIVNEKKKKDDQRQLIDFFVHGENARTTAIVKAYLETDFKTPTAIGKYLGLDHKQVTRALTRLAAKYDSKQYGDYSDYLVAL